MPSVGSCLQGCVQSVWVDGFIFSSCALSSLSLSPCSLSPCSLSLLCLCLSCLSPISLPSLSLSLSLSFCLPALPSYLSCPHPTLFLALISPSVQAPWCHSPCDCCTPSFLNTWPRPKRLWTACTILNLSALL